MENSQTYCDPDISDDSLETIENQYSSDPQKVDTFDLGASKTKFKESATSKKDHYTTKNSRALASIDPYNTPLRIDSLRSAKIESASEKPGVYGYSKMKTTIDETFHRGFKDKLSELETLKYNYTMLQERNQMTGQRIEELEKENKIIDKKYQKLKDMYRVLKEQHNNDREAVVELKSKNAEYEKNIEEIMNQLEETLNNKKSLEQENKQLGKKLEKMTKENKESSAKLEQKHNIVVDKLEKEKLELLQKFKQTKKNMNEDLEKLIQQRNGILNEKELGEDTLSKLNSKYTETLELNQRLKEDIIQYKIYSESLQAENETLKSETSRLKRELEASFKKNLAKEERKKKEREQQKLEEKGKELQDLNNLDNFEQTINLLQEKHKEEHVRDQEKLKSLSLENAKLKKENEYLTKAIDSVQEEYLEFKKSVQEEKKKSEKPNQNIYNDPQTYLKEIEELNLKVRELEDQKSKLMYESNKTKFDYGYLEAQMTQFQDTIYRLESQNEKLQHDLSNKEYIDENDHLEKIDLLQDLQSKEQEISSLKLREKGHIQTIKELELLLEDVKLHQAENEQKNRLTYSNSLSELSETVDVQNLKQDSKDEDSSLEKESGFINHSHTQKDPKIYIEDNDEEGADSRPKEKASDSLALKPSLLTVNYEVQRLTEKYNDIKSRYQSLHTQK